MMPTSLPHVQRFAVPLDCGYETPCYIWTGFRNKKGYAKYTDIDHKLGSQLVHRQVYIAEHGSIPPGHDIDHLCRQPSCVRGSHLEAVLPRENARRAGSLRLSEYDVLYIRNSGESGKHLAKMFDITKDHVSRIRQRHSWAHLDDQVCYAELRLLTETARAPTQAHITDAGHDLYADVPEAVNGWLQVPAGESIRVPTGVAIQVPPGFFYEMRGRSSTFAKHGLLTVPGLIDSGFQGELFGVLHNPSQTPKRVEHHQRLCQLTFHRVQSVGFQIVSEFRSSDRGTKGWGSSGQ